MNEERDPVRRLRAAWDELEPEPLGDDLAESDAQTRAAVEWMRGAWSRLDVPDVVPRRRPAAIVRRLPRWQLATAAAGLLAFAIGLGRIDREAAVPREAALGPIASVEPPAPVPSRAPIRPRFHADGSVEMRSGKVRLILLPGAGESESVSPSQTKETR